MTAPAPLTAAEIARLGFVLPNVIALLREAWPNDGAEGESVHAVCDAAERLLATVAARDTENAALRAAAEQRDAIGDEVTAHFLEGTEDPGEKLDLAETRARIEARRRHPDPDPGHVLAREGGEPQHLGTCERCGLSNVAAGGACAGAAEKGGAR